MTGNGTTTNATASSPAQTPAYRPLPTLPSGGGSVQPTVNPQANNYRPQNSQAQVQGTGTGNLRIGGVGVSNPAQRIVF